ncbi:MAG: hypothetical protein M1830_004702 [Pleopsidium flavum]|nr:MAG: hypothetical protein M1830_004702 [Pleopsidium flavum]
MTYQNGDIYEGAWLADKMHGEGKIVYAATGNTYVGGFKKGKRFGKGTMHYLVADEEMKACQICYESEQDALFYDCGHIDWDMKDDYAVIDDDDDDTTRFENELNSWTVVLWWMSTG